MTCAISNLPIEYGDRIKYLMVTENPYNDDNIQCYSHSLWFPRAFALTGTYNDYGSIENVEHEGLQNLWLKGLKLDIVTKEQGENPYHDPPTHPDMSFDKLIEALWEGRVDAYRGSFASWCFKHDRFQESMRIADEVLAKYGKPPLIAPSKDRQVRLCKDKKPIRVMQCMVREDVWNAVLRTEYDTGWSASRPVSYWRDKAQEEWIKDGTFGHEAVPLAQNLDTAFEVAMRNQDSLTSAEVDAFLTSAAETVHVGATMNTLRAHWRPSYGIGPQFGEWDAHEQFHKSMFEIARDIRQKREEE